MFYLQFCLLHTNASTRLVYASLKIVLYDVMSQNELTTMVKQLKCFTWSFDLLRQEKKDLGRGFDQVEDQRPNLIRLFKNLL